MKHELQYYDDGDLAVYNGYSFRKDKKTGYYLSSKKIGSRRRRLHDYVYECETGNRIKRGWHIHHIDENKDNNDISNLVMLSASDHAQEHANAITEERREAMRENLISNAVPASKAWHKTDAGREWHRNHAAEVAKNLLPVEYVCMNCGKVFTTKNRYADGSNIFCSNNCKSAYRRKSGVDNVEKTCLICGATFQTNKYSPAKYCAKHRRGKN